MFRLFAFIALLFSTVNALQAQVLLSPADAVQRAVQNGRNLQAANLSIQQQQALVGAATDFQNPQLTAEVTPYEPLIVGVQQTFSLPGVYRARQGLQRERIRLAQLQLLNLQYDLNRDVRTSYLQLQYLTERQTLLQYQDSIYQAIKAAAQRFFAAGQINKLEELQAATQADAVRNNLQRVQTDAVAEQQLFRFYTALTDSFTVQPLTADLIAVEGDTSAVTYAQQLLQQQVTLSQQQLKTERLELLPQLQAGVLLPTTREFDRPIGFGGGVYLPLYRKQNRSRIQAATFGVQAAQAQQDLERQRLNALYRQAVAAYRREAASIAYYNNTALQQARSIIETSQRLFDGGQLNYIESLRNLQTAFDILNNHLETLRTYNEAVIQLNYLTGRL